MHWRVSLFLNCFQQSSEPLAARAARPPGPSEPRHTAAPQNQQRLAPKGKRLHRLTKAPRTDKGTRDWQRLHRPDISLWHLASPQMNSIHTCTNKLFRKLLETVFSSLSFFKSLFRSSLQSSACPHCLRFNRSLLCSHSPVHRLTVDNTTPLMED